VAAESEDIKGDVVTDQWITRHGIAIPRAAGVHQSDTAWVKVNGSGTVVAAGERDQTILAWLVETGRLMNTDIDYGIAYVTCRSAERAYRRQMGFKSSLDLSMLAGGGGLSCEQAAKVFCVMRRALGHELCKVIEYACDTMRTADGPRKHDYRKAFSSLAREFDDSVKAVRDGMVPDEPQPMRSGLEKILARGISGQ
jgi:hypothetical protein